MSVTVTRNRNDSSEGPDQEPRDRRIVGAAAVLASASAAVGLILIEGIQSDLPGRSSATPIFVAFGLAVVLLSVALLVVRRKTGIETWGLTPPGGLRQGSDPLAFGAEALRLMQIEALNRRLLTHGETGRARILSVQSEEAVESGRRRIIEFLLEVYPVGRKVFTARAVGVAERAAVGRYQPGREVWIKLDLSDKTRVALCQL